MKFENSKKKKKKYFNIKLLGNLSIVSQVVSMGLTEGQIDITQLISLFAVL
jgi:hypothetical protein